MKQILIHIGFHKTGTSWLQNVYFSNSDYFSLLNDTRKPWEDPLCKAIIRYPESKFSTDSCWRIVGERLKADKINVLSAERFSGHPISGGFDSFRTAERLYRLFPDSKIVVAIRDSESFIASAYRQILKEGYCGTMEEFLSESSWKTAGRERDYFQMFPIVNKYVELFGERNVCTLNFRLFQTDKKKYIQKLNNFCGLNGLLPDSSSLNKIVNPTFSDSRLKALCFLNKFRKSEYNPFPLISFSDSAIRKASRLLSIFYSNSSLTDSSKIKNYLEDGIESGLSDREVNNHKKSTPDSNRFETGP